MIPDAIIREILAAHNDVILSRELDIEKHPERSQRIRDAQLRFDAIMRIAREHIAILDEGSEG